MDERDVVEALGRLGLSKYEGEVFVALQKLSVSTARDVARATEVPRSQVYGAAESLEERGLIEVQHANPIKYRAVALEEAKDRLTRDLEAERDRAFEFLEDVRGSYDNSDEQRQAIWTIQGRTNVSDRVRAIVRDAEDHVVHGFGADFLADDVVDALADAAADGVAVTVVSADAAVVEAFADSPVTARQLPADLTREEWNGARVLVADGDTVLLSVLGEAELPDVTEETAFWSAETAFATVLVQLVNGWFQTHAEG